MGISAGIVGASGYAGGELLRLLAGHPAFELTALVAAGSAGLPVTDLHPHLPQLADRSFDSLDSGVLAGCDVVFLALPHGESAAIAATCPSPTLVVDLGADHRLARRRRVGALLRRAVRRHLDLRPAGAARPARR